MRVPFLDLERHHAPLDEALLAALGDVVRSRQFILGPSVREFERELAEYLGRGLVIGVSSGSDALLAALMALGVGPGDEVVTTPFTFFATAGAAARLGARVVFADIEPASMNLSPAAALGKVTGRTRALIPVHLYGRMADLAALEAGLPAGVALVEDSAQSLGARDEAGRLAGTVGALGCFSFFPAKNLGALGDAGALATGDQGLAERVRALRVHGAQPKYHHHFIGGNFRLDALQAAALRVKLPHLEVATEARRRNARRYRELLSAAGLSHDMGGPVRLPGDGPGRHVYHQFVVRVARRDELREYLAARGVMTMIYYPRPLHLQPCFADLGGRRGDFPESEQAADEVLALPIFPELTHDEQSYVVETIGRFFKGRPKCV